MHHFTGKNTGPFGAAIVGSACNEPTPVAWSEDRNRVHQTMAHEVGHVLSGVHGDGTNCTTDFVRTIMCQGDNKQLTFSTASRNRITNFLDSKNCFNYNTASISGDNGMCVSNIRTYSLTNFNTTAGTNVTWSTNSRLTILSGQGTESVSVRGMSNGAGVLTAVLDYPGSCGSITETKTIAVGPPIMSLTVNNPQPNGTVYANVTGGVSPYTWKLNGNTIQTSTTAGVYLNIGCNGGYLQVFSTVCNATGQVGKPVNICSGGYSYSIVYPNPTSNEIRIAENKHSVKSRNSSMAGEGKISFLRGIITLELYDFSGSMVRSENLDGYREELKLNVRDFKKGSYFLKISGKDIEEVHKVIIE